MTPFTDRCSFAQNLTLPHHNLLHFKCSIYEYYNALLHISQGDKEEQSRLSGRFFSGKKNACFILIVDDNRAFQRTSTLTIAL